MILSYLQSSLDQVSQGLTVFDENYRLMLYNRAYLTLLNLPSNVVYIGVPLEDLFRFNAERGEYGPGEIEALVAERLERAKSGQAHTYERTTGGGRVIEVSRTPLPGGGLVATYADVTERRRYEEHLKLSLRRQEVVSALLALALEPGSLDEALERMLSMVLNNATVSIEAKGCVFVVDDKTGDLEMRAQQGLAPPLLDKCARVEPGNCLCGRAVLENEPVHAAHVDHRHETSFDGMADHGHYCLALRSGGRTLGVLNLYVEAGHTRNFTDDHFVTAVADAMAGVIDRKLTEERLEQLGRAVEQSPASVVITDDQGVIEYVNPKFERVSGYSREEAIGQRPSILKSGDKSDDDYRELWHTITAGKTWRGEFHNKRKDGSLYWEAASISPIRAEDGAISHFVGVKEDITERKRSEVELRRASEEAMAASRAKTEFLTNMGHELRTPLNSIIGFSEIMATQMLGPVGTPSYVEYAQDIKKSGEHLLEVINDVLDVSRIETGSIALHEEDLDPAAIVTACLRIIRERADQGEVRLIWNPPEPGTLPALRADPRRLKQILTNLLSNAVKFTPSGGRVAVAIALDGDGKLEFSVSDTGVGIPAKDLDDITRPFHQVDGSLARKFEGTGLGLPLCKSLTELHGGTLHIESELGSGTRVTVTLPAERVLAPGAAESARATA